MIKDALTINLHSGRTCTDGRDPTGSGGVSADGIEWILDLMDQHQSQATFFVCDHTARVHEVSVKAIAGRGHEIALWSVLVEAGFRNDSSVLPYRSHPGKQQSLPRYPFRLALGGDTLFEWPIATAELFGGLFPVACEPYWRLVPYWLLRRSLQAYHWGNWPAVVTIEFDLRLFDPAIADTRKTKPARRNDRRMRRLGQLLCDSRFETLEIAIGRLGAAELTMLRLKSTPCVQTEGPIKRN
jgi:hypothetical protein